MAALYLHNALFTNEPPSPPPPSFSRRPLSSRTPHDRQLSSQSSVTLHTSTSEHSHPTEPLLHGESSAYRDLLSQQPVHPSGPRTGWETALSLDMEPVSSGELRRLSDLSLRKRIRRLRWAANSVLYLMGAWAVFTTIRYAIAVTIYVSNDRKTILLVLASVSAFTVTLVIASIVLSVFSRTLGWDLGLRSTYVTIQSLLGFSTSLSLLGPAMTNFVLVFLWRNASDAADSLRGRCSWDIDVAWSGTGGQCTADHAKGWGFWLGGALFRLILTFTAVMAYHFLLHKYAHARKPSRRKHGRTHLHSVSSAPSTGSETLHSDRSYQVMVSTNHLPISLNRAGRQYSRSTEISEGSHESGASSGSGEQQRSSRTSHSRTREVLQTHSHSRDGQSSAIRFSDDSPGSSEEDLLSGDSATSRYGTPIRHIPGQYSLVPPDNSRPFPSVRDASASSNAATDHNLNSFVGRFRSLVNEVSDETDTGMRLAQNDRPGYYVDRRAPSPNMTIVSGQPLEDEEFFIVGGVVQRMPTIESFGSREVMSLATSSNSRGDRSIRSLSRPPTRQAISIFSDGTSSQPTSRSNSLNASIALYPASPLESSFGGTVSELGELQKSTSLHSAGTHRPSTKSSSSGTYYTAASAASAPKDGSEISGPSSQQG